MHEMALCESVVQILERQALAQQFSRVISIRLAIGALASVEPEAMRFSFDAVARGTLAEGARLEIIYEPGSAWCMFCARAVEVKRRFEECPHCRNELLQLTSGDELRVNELEVE